MEIWVGSGSLHSTYSWSLGPEGVSLDVRCPIVPPRKWKLGGFQRLVQSLPVQPWVEAELELSCLPPNLLPCSILLRTLRLPWRGEGLVSRGIWEHHGMGHNRGSLLGARAMVFPPDSQHQGVNQSQWSSCKLSPSGSHKGVQIGR